MHGFKIGVGINFTGHLIGQPRDFRPIHRVTGRLINRLGHRFHRVVCGELSENSVDIFEIVHRRFSCVCSDSTLDYRPVNPTTYSFFPYNAVRKIVVFWYGDCYVANIMPKKNRGPPRSS